MVEYSTERSTARMVVLAVQSVVHCTTVLLVQRILGAGATLAPPMGASGTTSAGGASPAVECTDGKIDSLAENQENLAQEVRKL